MLAKQGGNVDKVLNFAIDDAILEERITGRWIHPSSGRTYHTKFAPPKSPGVDDVSRVHIISMSCLFYVYMIILVLFLLSSSLSWDRFSIFLCKFKFSNQLHLT